MAVVPRTGPSLLSAESPAQQPTPSAAYVVSGRDLRIDFLRGLCVIAMIVDHVAGASWLYGLTGGNRFYTSAAEGFVFVSGLVAGRAYTRFIRRDGLGYGLGRILGRAGQLYVLAICLALVFIPVSEVLQLPWALGWNLHDSLDFVVSIVTLHRTYYLVDVMLLYVLLLVTASVAFVLCSRGQAGLVLVASWLLWLVFQFFPDQAAIWPIVGNNLFFFSAWQVLFFTGLVIGHSWEQGTVNLASDWRGKFLQRLVDVVQIDAARRRALWVTGALLAGTIAFYLVEGKVLDIVFRHSPDPGLAQAMLLTSVFGKTDLKFGRVLVFGLVFIVFFLAATEWWTVLRRWLGWLVLPLGKNALYAYSAHVIIAAGVAIVAQRTLGTLDTASARQNAAIQAASVLVVWALVRLRPPAWVFSSRPMGVATPVLLAAAALVVLPRVTLPVADSVSSPAAATADAPDTAAATVARAYGTVIPAGAPVPSLPASAMAPPVPQATANPTGVPASTAAGPLQGTLLEPQFHSAALNTDERYFVYLPPGYQSGKRFPVLYMLHGGGGRHEWIDYGLIGMADQAISGGTVPPMIIVLPQGDEGYWVNHNNGGPRWGDYLAQDIVGQIDATYPTQADAKHRAIGGLSSGGWGALYQAFAHPDVFGVVGAHAPSLRGDDGSMPFLPRGAQFNQFDPVQLASNAPGITGLHVWVDADGKDPWVKRDADLHTRLDQRHIVNEWNTYPGQHGGSYWHDHVQDYLKFYGKMFASS